MKKEVEIKVPTSWEGVTLSQYLKLQRDLEVYGNDEISHTATLLYHLCGVTPSMITQLPTDILNSIKMDLRGFMGKNDFDLKSIITIDGKEYGFEPNLSKMSYGAYLDITKFESINIDKNWKHIMSVLYRPVTKKTLKLYDIEPYDSKKVNPDIFEDVSMDVHFAVFFYLINTLADLVNDILNSLKEVELPLNIKQTLEKNGEVIKQLYNYQETISPNSMMFFKGH